MNNFCRNARRELFVLLVLASVLLSGCDTAGEPTQPEDSNFSLIAPRVLLENRMFDPAQLQLLVTQNGQAVDMNRNANTNAWSGQINVPQGQSINLMVGWAIFSPQQNRTVSLAVLTADINNVSSNLDVSFNSSNYSYPDDDGDSITNLDEVNQEFSETPTGPQVFNAQQSDCLTESFINEASALAYVLPDNFSFTTNTDFDFLRLDQGTRDVNYTVGAGSQVLVDALWLPAAGTLLIDHVGGVPSDSVGLLYQRLANGQLQLLASNDDDADDPVNSLFFSIEIALPAGGYCLMAHRFGVGAADEPAFFRNLSDEDSTMSITYTVTQN